MEMLRKIPLFILDYFEKIRFNLMEHHIILKHGYLLWRETLYFKFQNETSQSVMKGDGPQKKIDHCLLIRNLCTWMWKSLFFYKYELRSFFHFPYLFLDDLLQIILVGASAAAWIYLHLGHAYYKKKETPALSK